MFFSWCHEGTFRMSATNTFYVKFFTVFCERQFHLSPTPKIRNVCNSLLISNKGPYPNKVFWWGCWASQAVQSLRKLKTGWSWKNDDYKNNRKETKALLIKTSFMVGNASIFLRCPYQRYLSKPDKTGVLVLMLERWVRRSQWRKRTSEISACRRPRTVKVGSTWRRSPRRPPAAEEPRRGSSLGPKMPPEGSRIRRGGTRIGGFTQPHLPVLPSSELRANRRHKAAEPKRLN